MYKYKALVIDDELQIHEIIKSCSNILHKKYELNIDFTIVNNSKDFNDNIIYDLLLVDYCLVSGFNLPDNQTSGEYFINLVRDKNKYCRIIFYSSNFIYTDTKKDINLPNTLLYDIINKYSVNSIVAKGNTNQLVEEIKKNCLDIDVIPLILTKIFDEYNDAGMDFNYYINNTYYSPEEMKINILKNNEIGAKFREDLIQSFLQRYVKFGK